MLRDVDGKGGGGEGHSPPDPLLHRRVALREVPYRPQRPLSEHGAALFCVTLGKDQLHPSQRSHGVLHPLLAECNVAKD